MVAARFLVAARTATRRSVELLPAAFAQGIEDDDGHVALPRLLKIVKQPGRIRADVLAEGKDAAGLVEILQQHGAEPSQLNIRSNRLAGAEANRNKADRQAEQYRAIVEELEADLPAGELLSPSVLMHRLNELGIRPPRSERWSLNGAKRLLARIRLVR